MIQTFIYNSRNTVYFHSLFECIALSTSINEHSLGLYLSTKEYHEYAVCDVLNPGEFIRIAMSVASSLP